MSATKKVKLAGLSCLCAAVFLPSVQVAAEVVRVASGDAAALAAAVNAANEGDEIVVASGVYLLDHTISNKTSTTITLRGETGRPEDVVLDGQGKTRCLYLTSKGAISGGQAEPAAAALATRVKGLTIRNGFVDDKDPNCQDTVAGGGLFIKNGIVENCIFEDCLATNGAIAGADVRGGGIFATVALISNTVFKSCRAISGINTKASGGGIQSFNGGANWRFRAVDCTFTNCVALGNAQSAGGGFLLSGGGGSVDLSGNVFLACKSSVGGGANVGDGALLDQSRFFANAAQDGGGLYAQNECVVSNCLFEANRASGGGSGIKGQNISLYSSSFIGNETAGKEGGAIAATGKVVARNSLFEGNSVVNAGSAIWLGAWNGCADIEDCIFRANKATETKSQNASGGALALNRKGNCIVNRCLFDGNESNLKPDNYYDCGGSAINVNLASDTTNVIVRNCHFRSNAKAPVIVVTKMGTTETATWSNGLGCYLQNCTFTDNSFASDAADKSAVIYASASACQQLFVENCLFLRNEGTTRTTPLANVLSAKFLSEYANQVRNCSSDVADGFPADTGDNRTDGKYKNKGLASEWMKGAATDGGDGTWSVTPVGKYGCFVAANNVGRRVSGSAPDIGATEAPHTGFILLVR